VIKHEHFEKPVLGKIEVKPTIVTNPEVKETLYVKESGSTHVNPDLHFKDQKLH